MFYITLVLLVASATYRISIILIHPTKCSTALMVPNLAMVDYPN